jgi:hypothetical protein
MSSDEKGAGIAAGLFLNELISLPCTECGTEFEKPVSWFEKHDRFTCSQQGCGKVMEFGGVDEFRAGLKEARQGFIEMWNRIPYSLDCKAN